MLIQQKKLYISREQPGSIDERRLGVALKMIPRYFSQWVAIYSFKDIVDLRSSTLLVCQRRSEDVNSHQLLEQRWAEWA